MLIEIIGKIILRIKSRGLIMSNPNYRAIYLENKYNCVENDAMTFTFVVYDSNNSIVEDLSLFKFAFTMDSGALEVDKKDSNYSGGGNTQISISGHKISIYFDEDDTNNFEDTWATGILQMTEKSSDKRYTIFRKKFNFYKEILDW